MKSARTIFTAASLLASVTTASAGLFGSCESRLGTPTNLTATFNAAPGSQSSTGSIDLSFINTAHTGGTIYWDVEVRDGAGNPVGLDRAGSYATPSTQGGSVGIANSFTMPPLRPNTTYCFRVRARDDGGTNGCTSEIWGNQACVTTPDPAIAKFCAQYADDARGEAQTMVSYQKNTTCAAAIMNENPPRWTVDHAAHYNWCMAVRGDPRLASWPDIERNARNEALRTCRPAISIYSGGGDWGELLGIPLPKSSPPPPPSAPPPPSPTVCAVNALVTVEQCYNLDGTPSQYYTPGSTQAAGCGTSKDEAVNAAKVSLGVLLSDDPAPGSCTFSKKVFGGVCACSPRRNVRVRIHPRSGVPQASCAGDMKPDAAGRCACPSGTSQSGFRCVDMSRPGSRPGSVDSGRPPRRCPAGTFGRWPNCYRPGTHGTPSGETHIGRSCPRGTFGRWPNCYRPGTHATPNGETHTGRSCPRGTYGRPPNCYRPSTHRRPGRGTGGNEPPPIVVR